MPALSPVVLPIDRVVVAVGKEVLVPSGAAGGKSSYLGRIRVDEPSPAGVVIPGVQIVESRLGRTGVCTRKSGGARCFIFLRI